MNYLTERKYSFTSSALPGDAFAVVSFTGEEGLSKPYRFEIGLVTGATDIDLDAVMEVAAKFVIHREEGGDVPFSGILTAFEQQHSVDGFIFYQATLVPRLWWLSLTRHNQVFLGKTVKEMVEEVLKDGGLTSLDYEFRLQSNYEPQQYVCQYAESHLDFIDRWLAREGIYYYFEQTEHGEKIIFTDTAIAHGESRYGWELTFSPPSGLGAQHTAESVQGFVCRQHLLPGRVLLKDYNYRKPGLEMTGSAEVDPKGRGERFVYGEHFKTPEEGNRLAKIRAQELLCRKREFIGESTVPYVTPGFTFTLQDHYQSGFNQKYLTLEMTHAGSQTGYLISGIHKGLSERERTVAYRNQFTAIPAGVQFRAPKTSDTPKITGTLNAKIDAEGTGQYAELDDQGRYKVLLPFDVSGRKDGKGSAWLRMAQPYAGTDHGMHFPLHKGTEVLLTFIDGNPDRPLIQSAVPNPDTPSVVTSKSQTASRIKTASGHKMELEDKAGKESVGLFCSHGDGDGSWLWMGKRSPPSFELVSKGNKHEVVSGQEDSVILGSANHVVIGSYMGMKIGTVSEFTLAQKFVAELAGTLEVKGGHHLEFGKTTERIKDSDELLGTESVTLEAGLSAADRVALGGIYQKTALGVAAFGALLAAAGGDLAAIKYDKELHSAKEGSAQPMGLSLAAIVPGIALQTAALYYLVKQVKTKLVRPYSTLHLNANGIKIHNSFVDPFDMLGAPSGIRIGVRGTVDAPETMIHILPGPDGDGDTIKIKRGTTGGMITVSGTGVKIEKQGGGKIEVETGANPDNGKIVLTKGAGKVVVSDGAVEVTTGVEGTGKLNVAQEQVLMKRGDNWIEIVPQGVSLGAGDAEFCLIGGRVYATGKIIQLG
ncbi:MAG: type VI secretion system tip protein TssI/VgrG [Pseudomonadota bacterium]